MDRQRRAVMVLVALACSQALWAADVVDLAALGSAQVNWTRGVVTARGLSPADGQRPGQRRTALEQARAHALEAVEGIHITSETTVGLYRQASETVRARLDTILDSARLTRDGFVPESKDYEVVIELPLFGRTDHASGVVSAVLPEMRALEAKAIELRNKTISPLTINKAVPEVPPVDPPAVVLPPAVALPPRKPGPYTGLIIEATGYQLQRCMCPKILRRDGTEVWGTFDVTSAFVQETGIAGFAPTLADALNAKLNPRVGDNPLIVRAVGRQGTVWANALVSDEEAKLILAEGAKTKFLTEFKVTFVVGE